MSVEGCSETSGGWVEARLRIWEGHVRYNWVGCGHGCIEVRVTRERSRRAGMRPVVEKGRSDII